jgi:hypothetical protein
MKRSLISFAVLLGLFAALAPVGAPPAHASAGPAYAYRVDLDRTGGIAGRHDHWTVLRSTPDPEVRRLMWLVGSRGFRSLRPSYEPADPCCDRFTYRVTVQYRAGRTKHVTTLDGASAPSVLWSVIHLVQNIEGSGPHSNH